MDVENVVTLSKNLASLDNSSFLDDEFIQHTFNSCYRDVFNQWSTSQQSYLFKYIILKLTDFNKTSYNEYQYNLDVLQIRTVEYLDNANGWVPIDRTNPRNKEQYGYNYIGTTLFLNPVSTWPLIRISYLPKVPEYERNLIDISTNQIGIGSNVYFDNSLFLNQKYYHNGNIVFFTCDGTNWKINGYSIKNNLLQFTKNIFTYVSGDVIKPLCIGFNYIIIQKYSGSVYSQYYINLSNLSVTQISGSQFAYNMSSCTIDKIGNDIYLYFISGSVSGVITAKNFVYYLNLTNVNTLSFYFTKNNFVYGLNSLGNFVIYDQSNVLLYQSDSFYSKLSRDEKTGLFALFSSFDNLACQKFDIFEFNEYSHSVEKKYEYFFNINSTTEFYVNTEPMNGKIFIVKLLFTTPNYFIEGISEYQVNFEDFKNDVYNDLLITKIAIEFQRKQHADLTILNERFNEIKQRIDSELRKDLNSVMKIRKVTYKRGY